MSKIIIEPDAGTERDVIERFQRVLTGLVDNLGNLAAIAAIDVRGRGRCYFSAGHTSIERDILAQATHLYQIGSQTKTTVALLMLMLHRQEVIDLDESACTYVDLPIDRRITVRHLIMNQSGIGEITMAVAPERWNPSIKYAPRDLVALALPQGQLFEPGTRFDYCNTGWAIAGMIAEIAGGKAYGELIRELVLEPLELRSTWFDGTAPRERMLRGYLKSEGTGELIDTSSEALSWAFGAGDGVSCLDDMLDLYSALCVDNRLQIHLTDLNRDVARPSERPYFPLSIGTVYGLGVERREWAGSEVWGHPGSTMTYLSGTWVDVDRGVTIATCVTRATSFPVPGGELTYPREQIFGLALNTGYILAGPSC